MVKTLSTQAFKSELLYQYNHYAIHEAAWEDMPESVRKKISKFRSEAFGSYFSDASEDVDKYDETYRHIYMVDTLTDDIVAYYRMGLTQTILPKHGLEGFYISSLYDVDRAFFERTPNSAEMGRFIMDQDQSRTQFLFPLLWKSLYLFAEKYNLKFYFGMVTLSNDFKPEAIRKMAGFMRRHAFDAENSPYFKPKHPLLLQEEDILGAPETVPELQSVVRALQGEKGPHVPVMYRTYMSYADAKYLTCGYDPDFANSIDIIITGHPYTDIVKQIIKKF